MGDPVSLVRELAGNHRESEWLEFKHNTNDPEMIAERISAIANGSAMVGRSSGYMVWGVDDGTHDIIGTSFDPWTQKVRGQELIGWLRSMMSDNAVFDFTGCTVDGHPMVVLRVGPATGYPVSFRSREYIRDGSYTKLLVERPQLASALWSALGSRMIETTSAMEDCSEEDVRRLLSVEAILSMLKLPVTLRDGSLMDSLEDNGILSRQDDGRYSVTVLGALLFARDLSRFRSLSRKALRIVRYNGDSRTEIGRQFEDMRGYALGFEDNIRTIMMMLPSREVIRTGRAVLTEDFSEVVIREVLTNAMVHQDLSVNGMNLSVEVFRNRVEITDPGVMLVEGDRLVDSAPRSRNDRMAAMMRRIGLSEEMGTGWDRIVDSSEEHGLSVPHVAPDVNGARVIINGPRPLDEMMYDEIVWNCYMHTCSRFMKGLVMTVSSLGERFDTDDVVWISDLISRACSRGLVKATEDPRLPDGFVPYWA